MADLDILRIHSLGLIEMRKIAFAWAEYAEQEFGMSCIYEEGELQDEVFFTKPGVKGYLLVTHGNLEIKVHLGILLKTFKATVENQIVKNLDLLLEGKHLKGKGKLAGLC